MIKAAVRSPNRSSKQSVLIEVMVRSLFKRCRFDEEAGDELLWFKRFVAIGSSGKR